MAFVVVAFCVTELVAVRAFTPILFAVRVAIEAIVVVRLSMTPVTKCPSVAKRFVDDAFVVEEFVAMIFVAVRVDDEPVSVIFGAVIVPATARLPRTFSFAFTVTLPFSFTWKFDALIEMVDPELPRTTSPPAVKSPPVERLFENEPDFATMPLPTSRPPWMNAFLSK